jgi:L-threonylcarbamoyladenylate synthase
MIVYHVMKVIDLDMAAERLQAGQIGVLKTDTLYGLVAPAGDATAVERVYQTKGRTPSKSPIILIASVEQLIDDYDETMLAHMNELWPGKNSVILPSPHGPQWLTRGNASIAYRLPADERLRALLGKSGPLIAPSANPEGETPATTIQEAYDYFGDTVDFYVDGGAVSDNTPSKLWRLQPDGVLERLR